MKRTAMLALLFHVAVVAVYAQGTPVKMTFSGPSVFGSFNLLEHDSSNDEDNFTGKSTLGSFTVTNVRAIANYVTTSSTCSASGQIFFQELAGAGVFRFEDGSLLQTSLTSGGDCIDPSGVAHCTLTFQITGGTGRFKNASGALTMTETVVLVESDTAGNPVLLAATGEFTGTISGVADTEQDQQL